MQNKYEVLEVVGEGAYGIVYKCRNKETGKYVAIKKFKEVEDEIVKKTMKRELRMLQRMHHENIVDFIEAFKRKGNLFLVFEYVEKNLLEILQDSPRGLEPKLIRHFMYQLCKAIKYLHNQNVIHRDVKPENLLVNEKMDLKLCDFGFARLISGSSKERLTDYVATRWYRAPELLLTQGEYGPEVDYWAVGCIMGELVDGNPLFPGENEIDQLHCIQKVLGNFTDEQVYLFYSNPIYNGKELLEVEKPETLDWRYLGKLPKNAISFMKGLLELDPKKRLNGNNVFQHPYLVKLYEKDMKKENEKNSENVESFSNMNNNNNSNSNINSHNVHINNGSSNNIQVINNNNGSNIQVISNSNISNPNENINFNNESVPLEKISQNVLQTVKIKHNQPQNSSLNNNNIYVIQFQNNPNIQNFSKSERDNGGMNQTSITNINNINYNNYGEGFYPQEQIPKPQKPKNKKNKKKETNFNTLSMKKQNITKLTTSINFNQKDKDNMNLVSFMSTNNGGNTMLDNAYKTFYQKNKEKDIYNIELDSQYYNINESNENIRNYINRNYDVIHEEEEYPNDYNEYESKKMRQLVQLYKTNNNNMKMEHSPGRGVKHYKNSPPKNGSYYNGGKNYYSKNNVFIYL
jgi:cyclin-dependent kinase-like